MRLTPPRNILEFEYVYGSRMVSRSKPWFHSQLIMLKDPLTWPGRQRTDRCASYEEHCPFFVFFFFFVLFCFVLFFSCSWRRRDFLNEIHLFLPSPSLAWVLKLGTLKPRFFLSRKKSQKSKRRRSSFLRFLSTLEASGFQKSMPLALVR